VLRTPAGLVLLTAGTQRPSRASPLYDAHGTLHLRRTLQRCVAPRPLALCVAQQAVNVAQAELQDRQAAPVRSKLDASMLCSTQCVGTCLLRSEGACAHVAPDQLACDCDAVQLTMHCCSAGRSYRWQAWLAERCGACACMSATMSLLGPRPCELCPCRAGYCQTSLHSQ
jgi:hypothetical protein